MNELCDISKIEKLGWKLESEHKGLCTSFKWKPDGKHWNAPNLTIYFNKKTQNRVYLHIIINKFEGANDYHGHMGEVFRGKCKDISQLKMICKLLDLNKYFRF